MAPGPLSGPWEVGSGCPNKHATHMGRSAVPLPFFEVGPGKEEEFAVRSTLSRPGSFLEDPGGGTALSRPKVMEHGLFEGLSSSFPR